MIQYISKDEYIELWEDLKQRRCYTSPNIDPKMKNITVQGSSGPGTPFKNEYERLLHKHYNPDIPVEINWYEPDGMVTYRIKK